MKVVFNDGGRAAAGYKGRAGDCVTRASAIATGKPYQEVYEAMNAAGKRERIGSRKRGVSNAMKGVYKPAFRKYLENLGWKFVPTMSIGSGCKVHLHDGELPHGRLIVSLSRHLTTVIDGVIHDTFDPQREIHEFSKFLGWETVELKPGEKRNVNGIHRVRRRCVYGYFVLASEITK
jgi:hypothetical protein